MSYDAKNIEKLTTTYSASIHRVETRSDISNDIVSKKSQIIPVETSLLTYLSFFALFIFLISVFLHPYARITHHA